PARLHGHGAERDLGERVLDHLVRALAHATGRQHQVTQGGGTLERDAQDLRVVGHAHAQPDAGAGGADRGRQRGAGRVPDPARPRCMATARNVTSGSASLTTSYAPWLTPPVVSTRSHRAAARSSVTRRISGSSGTLTRSPTRAPAARTAASSAGPFASQTWPGPGSPSDGTSSLPVETTASETGARSGSRVMPHAAAAATWCGASTVPARSTTSPAATSDPGSRTYSPAPRPRTTVTVDAGPPVTPLKVTWSVSSTGTTASAPAGTGAPVMMRTAVPGSSGAGRPGAAATSPATGSVTGTPGAAAATSSARTANPSIWELRKRGRAAGAATSRATTRPSTSR